MKVTKRADGRYMASVYLGTEGGKKKYKYIYGSTRKEVTAKATKLKYAMGKGQDILSGDMPFSEWANRWVTLKEGKVSDIYFRGIKGKAKWWAETLGNTPMASISRSQLQQALNSLSKHNLTSRKKTAKKTLADYKRVAASIFDLAMDDRAIDYNPAKRLEVPNNAPKSQRRALTAEEQRWILDTPHRAQTAAMIMMLAGLRRGEVLALTGADIDVGTKTIKVDKAVVMVSNKPVVKRGGKTDAATRTVVMPDILADYLRTALAGKSPWDLVCPNTQGKLMSESSWKRLWQSYLSDLNLKYGNFSEIRSKFDPKGAPMMIPHITPHWLRHTAATNLVMSGVDPVTAQRQLGHADIATTLNIYTHITADHQTAEVSKLDEYLASMA